MSLWDFIGEFAIFNFICNLFSSKPKPSYDSDCFTPSTLNPNSSKEEIQRRIYELEAMRDRTPVTAGYYFEILNAIEATREWLKCKVDVENIQKELDDLQNEINESEYDRDLYDDDDDDW